MELPIASSSGSDSVRLILERSADAAMLTDPAGRIQYVNSAFVGMTGYTFEDVRGRTPGLLKSGCQSAEFYRSLWQNLRAGNPFTGVFINRRRNGELFHVDESIWPLVDAAGRITHYLSTGRDVSERMAMLERLAQAATHDHLTGLPNRVLLLDRIEQALRQARRTSERFVVAVADIDKFKLVNDSLGHQAGDMLLQHAAQRLRRCIREEDTIARLGGDEFAFVLRGVWSSKSISEVLRKIVGSFTDPMQIAGNTLHVTASAGGCAWTRPDQTAELLLAAADRAMYCVKRSGGNAFAVEEAMRGAAAIATTGDTTRFR